MNDDDLMAELFPGMASNNNSQIADGCFTAFVAQILLDDGLDPERTQAAFQSFQQAIPSPVPEIVTQVSDTLEGVLARAVIWVYIFVILAFIALVWFLCGLGVISWKAALLFSALVIIMAVIIAFIAGALINAFVRIRKQMLSDYIAGWVNLYFPQIPAAINAAICAYVAAPGGTASSGSGNGPCIGCTDLAESKKTV